MKITDYFINHPVSAVILNSVIIFIGYLCFSGLQIREYPEIKTTSMVIETIYPNASSELVESSVTNVLEDELGGIEGVEDIRSWSSSNRSVIAIKFLPDISMDRGLIAIKDTISLVRGELPDQIKEPIIYRNSRNQGPPFMSICFQSSSMSLGDLTHYINTRIKNLIRSIKGVSSTKVYGRPYTYKVILDHKNMYRFGVNADEIYDAIAKANISFPAGKFQNKVPATIKIDLDKIEDFENILIKSGANPVFLKSVANIEASEDDRKDRFKINGTPSVCMGVQKSSDSNPLDVSNLVHEEVKKIKITLPEGINMGIGLDQAEFIRSSLQNIKSSIIEAIFFVLVIIFLFLRSIRATIIPIITIPLSLIGSLLFLKFFGFSINVMTLLAMVLAVGLVVDDAIIILENISRYIEEGETALKASLKGAKEIAFAVVAMTVTLASVYIPIAFVEGLTGQLFIEFAVALAGSVLISGVTAITLSPLMCAYILKKEEKRLFPVIDEFFVRLINRYNSCLRWVMKHNKALLIVITILFLSITIIFNILPKEILPSEDRGLIGVSIPALPGENINQIEANVNVIENVMKEIAEASSILSFTQEWGGFLILPLKPISERGRSADEIINSVRLKLLSFPSFDAWPWSFSSGLPGMDDPTESTELRMMISTTGSYKDLFLEANKIRDEAERRSLFRSIYHNLKLDTAGYNIFLDKQIMANLSIDNKKVAKAISLFFSGDDKLKFKKDGILYPIIIEGDTIPWTLNELYITNSKGKRISIGSFSKLSPKAEPKELEHFNQMRSVRMTTNLSGNDIGSTIKTLENLADDILPKDYKKDWIGIAKTFNDSSHTMAILFIFSTLFIYAILAVQFESFIDPLIILFTVPLACFGALLALYVTGGSLNIYSQVGLITLIGLISKHGILIVEFANKLQKQGVSALEAIEKAASLRLRPILMTTAAMLCGSVPLMISYSYGYESRKAIGLILFFGLGIGTIFTLFVLPSVYQLFNKFKR